MDVINFLDVIKLMEKEMKPDESIPAVVIMEVNTPSFIKGYHVYKNIWTPLLDEKFSAGSMPTNPADKYAVAMTINNVTVGHWTPPSDIGKFPKKIFDFLRADLFGKCTAIVTGKPLNLGDGEGMKLS